MKNLWLALPRFERNLCLFAAAFLLFNLLDATFFNLAFAAEDATAVFTKGTEKSNQLVAQLKGPIAVAITSVVIAVIGILMQMGRINHMVGVRIIIGVFIVGSCASIAAFFYS